MKKIYFLANPNYNIPFDVYNISFIETRNLILRNTLEQGIIENFGQSLIYGPKNPFKNVMLNF